MIHDKISGCFHSTDSAGHFTTVRPYLQPDITHDEKPLHALRELSPPGHGYHPHNLE